MNEDKPPNIRKRVTTGSSQSPGRAGNIRGERRRRVGGTSGGNDGNIGPMDDDDDSTGSRSNEIAAPGASQEGGNEEMKDFLWKI